MRTAIMEMYGAKKVKREAWVPESIADEQVEAFMEATVAAIAEGEDTFVFEAKHYKAKAKKEAKKLDPVGKADADIDNDGDVDSSDEYLKKRRAAIKKSMAEESCPECGADGECQCEQPVQEAADMDPKDHVKYNDEMEMYCVYNKDGKVVAKFKDEEDANNYAMKNHDDLMEVSYKTAMKSYQKAMGQSKDADTAGDKKTGDKKFDQAVKFGRYATKKFKSSKNKKKLVSTTRKEETVEEAAGTAQHGPNDATSDTYAKQMAAGENSIPKSKKKDIVDLHKTEVSLDAEELYQMNKYEALSKTPGRMGDQSIGDKNPVNPVKVDMVDSMRKVLAQMKTVN